MTESDGQTQGPRGARDDMQIPDTITHAPLPTPTAHAAEASDAAQPTTVGNVSGASVDTDLNTKSEFGTFAHRYIRDHIKLADQKATFCFTGATALLAFMYNENVSARWLIPVMQWNILDTIAFVAMAALAAGAFLAVLVVIPRTSGSRRGFLFWEAITEYETGRQYSDDLWQKSGPSLFQVKAEHCYDLAVVCKRKYWMLRRALWISAVGLAGALFVFLFL